MAEKIKNNILSDKLKELKLDYSTYGSLPQRLDVLAIIVPDGKPQSGLVNQLDKLFYIRKHLQKVDDYIKSGTKDPINIWDANTKAGLSTKVLSELKGHNNETGGISKYFYNLQKLYDDQEAIYDKMESECRVPEDTKSVIEKLRSERGEKRKTRSDLRKILVKDLKKDGKGFLYIEVEKEPGVEDLKKQDQNNASGKEDDAVEIKNETEKIKKSTKKIGIYFAGFTVVLTLVAVAIAATNKEK